MIDAWPINPPDVERIGQGTCTDCRKDKDGKARPHNGVDIYAKSGTDVLSPVKGSVIRVVDGRLSTDPKKLAAGLWIDIEEPPRNIAENNRIHRFLHLGEAYVKDGQRVSIGQKLGKIADGDTSGLGESGPHLHYEIRRTSGVEAYGRPYEPKYELADAVALHAYNTIPKIAHVIGIDRYENQAYIKINDMAKEVWSEKDPDKRLELAHNLDEYATSVGKTGFWESAKRDTEAKVKKKVIEPGKQALKDAGKEIAKGAGDWWDELSTGWKIGIVSGGVLVTGAVVKSFLPHNAKD